MVSHELNLRILTHPTNEKAMLWLLLNSINTQNTP